MTPSVPFVAWEVMMVRSNTAHHARFGALALLLATPVMGDFVTPDDFGWARGEARSAYFDWDVFTSVSGGNVPDAMFDAELPPGGVAPDVRELAGSSIITGIGSIYSLVNPIEIEATLPGFEREAGASPKSQDVTDVLVQIRTQGRELDLSSVLVNGRGALHVEELERIVLGDPDDIFGGSIVETLFLFQVQTTSNPLTLEFSAARESMSLDRLSVDYRGRRGAFVSSGPLLPAASEGFVAVPAAGGLGVLASAGLLAGRRRL